MAELSFKLYGEKARFLVTRTHDNGCGDGGAQGQNPQQEEADPLVLVHVRVTVLHYSSLSLSEL